MSCFLCMVVSYSMSLLLANVICLVAVIRRHRYHYYRSHRTFFCCCSFNFLCSLQFYFYSFSGHIFHLNSCNNKQILNKNSLHTCKTRKYHLSSRIERFIQSMGTMNKLFISRWFCVWFSHCARNIIK